MKKIIVFLVTRIVYLWGSIFYDKKYLTGKHFDKYHWTFGWRWIIKYWFPQKVLGYARDIPFPIPRGVIISNCKNIEFNPDDLRIFHSHGCYFQALKAKIHIGNGVWIAPNCGIITTNHDIYNLENHIEGKDIYIGNDCWLGMNSIILPGVKLGNNTIVGAGSIVTKSFEEGNCVIAGNPAKIIRKIDKEKVK